MRVIQQKKIKKINSINDKNKNLKTLNYINDNIPKKFEKKKNGLTFTKE